jgi:hypothetical protein
MWGGFHDEQKTSLAMACNPQSKAYTPGNMQFWTMSPRNISPRLPVISSSRRPQARPRTSQGIVTDLQRLIHRALDSKTALCFRKYGHRVLFKYLLFIYLFIYLRDFSQVPRSNRKLVRRKYNVALAESSEVAGSPCQKIICCMCG